MRKIVAEDYKIEVMRAPGDEGGYLAYIPQLDCWGDGETASEAMEEVIAVANDMIEIAIAEGIKLPIPNKFKTEDEFSGKLTLRLPKFLHAQLAKSAEEEGVSINQLILTFISIEIGKMFGEKKITINIGRNISNIQESVNKNNNKTSDWINGLTRNLDKKLSKSQ